MEPSGIHHFIDPFSPGMIRWNAQLRKLLSLEGKGLTLSFLSYSLLVHKSASLSGVSNLRFGNIKHTISLDYKMVKNDVFYFKNMH